MLIILDGWGVREDREGNAVAQANMPFLNKSQRQYPCSQLVTFGNAVGLPDKIMGNSEVGHLNIGAGRVVHQDLMRIDKAIEDGSFFENEAIGQLMEKNQEKRVNASSHGACFRRRCSQPIGPSSGASGHGQNQAIEASGRSRYS